MVTDSTPSPEHHASRAVRLTMINTAVNQSSSSTVKLSQLLQWQK